MENDNLNTLFKEHQGSFDTEEPIVGHQARFLEKLQEQNKTAIVSAKKSNWWRTLSIAAAIAALFVVGLGLFNQEPSINEQMAQISPEVGNTQLYFASLIEEQVKQLENESSPETKRIIDDTMMQLRKLESNYKLLEKDLLNGGNDKLILSAMITNFQTRIDLLQDVINQIETIKTLKNQNDENFTI